MTCTWAEGPKTISCLSLSPLLLLPTTLSCSHQCSLFWSFLDSIPTRKVHHRIFCHHFDPLPRTCSRNLAVVTFGHWYGSGRVGGLHGGATRFHPQLHITMRKSQHTPKSPMRVDEEFQTHDLSEKNILGPEYEW
jgi:hypothetical protein